MRSTNDPAFVGSARALISKLIRAVILLATASAADPALAMAEPARFDIPAEELPLALREFATQSHMQLLYQFGAVSGMKSNAVRGELEKHVALQQLLQGTGLRVTFTADDAATIGTDINDSDNSGDSPLTPKEGKANAADELRLAQLRQGTASGNHLESAPDETSLQEIVVTAQKRRETLQEVPVPVTAISADKLASSNKLRLQDYYAQVPGLALTASQFDGSSSISIRGITTGDYTNPTVGITVDDVPFGSSTALGGGYIVPDLDPGELARVEVLRGPQGTLYGASSMGGLLKYVTVDPSTDALSGRVKGGVSGVQNGAEMGYNVSASVNVPLGETLALRMSGSTRRDPGYITNVQSGQSGVNKTEVDGAHWSALWRPNDLVSVKLGALFQHSRLFGSPYDTVAPGLGDLQQSFLPGTGRVDRKFQAYNLSVNAKLGMVDLAWISGYSINNLNDSFDYTSLLGECCTSTQFNGVTGTPNTDANRTNKVSQELRLSGKFGRRIDWLLGGFYTHEYSPFLEQFLAATPTGAVVGTYASFDWYVTYAEAAAFTDITLHFTDQFDIQIGGRESQIRQSYAEVDSGPYVPTIETLGQPSPLVFPEVVAHASAFTYLVTPRFRLSPDFMVYARFASGYRPGGPSPTASAFGLPETYKPDRTQNYEIGLKADVLDHRLSLDGSLYYIGWKDIQLSLIDPDNSLQYSSNGSEARSKGVELSMQATPMGGLKIGGWVAWNDAALTRPLPAAASAFGAAGDRLPFSSRFSGSLSVDQHFPITGETTGFVGATLSYVGGREGLFASVASGSAQRQDLPAYAKTDVRAGAMYRSWTVDLFTNNVTNRRGLLGGGVASIVPSSFEYIQPRTVGVTVSRSFQ